MNRSKFVTSGSFVWEEMSSTTVKAPPAYLQDILPSSCTTAVRKAMQGLPKLVDAVLLLKVLFAVRPNLL